MIRGLGRKLALTLAVSILTAPLAFSQQRQPQQPADPVLERVRSLEEALTFMEQRLGKDIDDLMWFRQLEDIAEIDKVRYTGPPPRVVPNPTGQGAGNPVIVTAYTFIPKKYASAAKIPL